MAAHPLPATADNAATPNVGKPNIGKKTPPRSGKSVSLKIEGVAWPTISVGVLSLVLWGGAAYGAVAGVLSYGWAVAICTFAAYLAFTPMHDATHRSISKRGWINDVLGRVCGLLLLAPYPAFRYLHLQHHKHTNDPDEDPDHYSGNGPAWQLPLRWFTQDWAYYLRYIFKQKDRPRGEFGEALIEFTLFYLTAAALIVLGYGKPTILLWLLPARLAIGFLAFSFDYLPHWPYDATGKDDRYRATLNLREWWLTPVLLYQNYHLIHHLYPGVPFYRYAAVWRDQRETLIAHGARTRSLFAWNLEQRRQAR
ncbi:fatty acid desaturase [bacterium]|nr:fatty acid desaturase [bacterium]